MQPIKKARIGIALAIAGVTLAFLWWYSAGYLLLAWYGTHQVSALVFAASAVAPSVALAIIGLAGYGAGRRDFWKTYSKRKGLLTVLGLALMFVGGFFVAYTWAMSEYAASESLPQFAKPLTYYLASNSPYFILFALWLITGLLVFADSLEAYWQRE